MTLNYSLLTFTTDMFNNLTGSKLCWNTLSITSIKQHQTLALTAKKSVREKKKQK